MLLRIREAVPGDAENAAALLRASIAELCAPDHRGDPAIIARWCANKTSETVAAWIADPALAVRVAEAGGRVAGIAAATRSGEILLNYVAPAARFTGVSTALLATLEAFLAGLGHVEGRLESTATAAAFYRSRGWREAGPPVIAFGLPGQPMTKRF